MEAHDLRVIVDALPEMEFRNLGSFNEGGVGVFWSTDGTSPWERHPDDDEMLHVLKGNIDVTVLTDGGPVTTRVTAGCVFIVPRGLWHRQTLHGTVQELYVTPGRTEHSSADDPRAPA